MKKLILGLLLTFALSTTAFAEVESSVVSYEAYGIVLKGYIAYDKDVAGARPGVLIVHEWWGHNDYVQKRARQLAELGYVAFAIDMYGGGKSTKHPDQAGEFASQSMANMDLYKAKFVAAHDFLKTHEAVDPEKIAAIGYCFGGSTVLNMARMGVDLDGVVSFHGSLASSVVPEPGAIKAKILVCHGADDSMIPAEHVAAFKKEMDVAGADYTFMSYAGATHSFTNPDADRIGKEFGIPLGYSEEADKKSWQDMQDFFDKIFKD